VVDGRARNTGRRTKENSISLFSTTDQVHFADGKSFLDSAPHHAQFSFEDVEDLTTVEGSFLELYEDESVLES
jgi:hypothetical protein